MSPKEALSDPRANDYAGTETRNSSNYFEQVNKVKRQQQLVVQKARRGPTVAA